VIGDGVGPAVGQVEPEWPERVFVHAFAQLQRSYHGPSLALPMMSFKKCSLVDPAPGRASQAGAGGDYVKKN
jgi:hypothetical protein